MTKRTTKRIDQLWKTLVIDALRNIQAEGFDAAKTWIAGLDRLTGRLLPGVYVLAGHSGIGKTALALQIAVAAARQGHVVSYLAFEDRAPRLLLRALTCAHNQWIPRQWAQHVLPAWYEQGRVGPDSVAKALLGVKTVHDTKGLLPLLRFYEWSPHTAPTSPKEWAKLLRGGKGTGGLVIVDHLQSWADRFRNEDAVQYLMSDLARIARDLRVAIIAISSGTYMYDVTPSATTVLILDEAMHGRLKPAHITEAECLLQEHGVPSRHLTLEIAKNRYGDKGAVLLRHYPDRCFFEQIA
jgi:hypothetical protein